MSLHRIVHDLKSLLVGEDPAHTTMVTFGASLPQSNDFWDALLNWFNNQAGESNVPLPKPEEQHNDQPKQDADDEGDRVPVSFVDNSNTLVVMLLSGGDDATPVKIVSGHTFLTGQSGSGGSLDIHSIGFNTEPIQIPVEFHSFPIVSISNSVLTGVPLGPPPPPLIIPVTEIIPLPKPDNCGFDPTTFKDGIDPNDGQLTLREAVILANHAIPNGYGIDTICLGVGTYELNTPNSANGSQNAGILGDLKVTQDLVIQGDGEGVTFIDANWLSRVLDVCSGVTLTLKDLTITHGVASNGGAILNEGHLILDNVGLIDNQACNSGGAIASIDCNGGASVLINNSLIDSNSAQNGGGIFAIGFNEVVTINSSTLSHNYAGDGGAAFIDGFSQFNFINSTASGNIAFFGSGGAFEFTGFSIDHLQNSTISDNYTYTPWGGAVQGDNAASIFLGSTIVAGNGYNQDLSGGFEVGQIFNSNGNNLIGNTDNSDFPNTQQSTDITGTGVNPIDPLLGPLADNGGPTPTQALLSDSPAIGNGSNPDSLATDQRGDPRESNNGHTDIGAYQSPDTLTPIVLDMNDQGINMVSDPQPKVLFDAKGDGSLAQMDAWVGKNDAFLVFDNKGVPEISFTSFVPGAKTDLQGLQAFDTNSDHVLDQKDANFNQFGVWLDANQNGKIDPGEYLTLQDVGIVSISLQGNGVSTQGAGYTIFNEGTFETTNGAKHTFADVGVAYTPIAPPVETAKVAISDTGEIHKA